MIDLDEIRKTIATDHGTWLGENDPVLMQVTINELILSQYVEMIAAQNAEYVKKLTDAVDASIQKGIAESKVVAGRVITEGSNYARDQIRESVAEIFREADAKAASYLPVLKEDEALAIKARYFIYGSVGAVGSLLISWLAIHWLVKWPCS